MTDLYLGRSCWASRIERQKFDIDSDVEPYMCRTLCINYVNVFLNITALVIGLKPTSMTSHPLNSGLH